MFIEFPILIVAYSPTKIFSTVDDAGHAMLPVFLDPEKAEAYRRFFAREYSRPLDILAIEKPEKSIDFFQCVATVDRDLKYIVIDPPVPSQEDQVLQTFGVPQFIQQLQDQYPGKDRPRHPRKKAHSRRRPHSQKAKQKPR